MKRIVRIIHVYDERDLLKDKAFFNKCFIKWRENVDLNDDWFIPIKEGMEEDLKKLGFYDIDSSFTGFYNQGDGANIRCKITLRNALKTLKKSLSKYGLFVDTDNTIINIYSNTYYSYQHENILCVDYNLEFQDYDGSQNTINTITEVSENYMNEISNEILQYIKERSRKYYQDLNNFYDYLHSEDSFKEEINNSNLLFKLNGDIFYEENDDIIEEEYNE